MQIAKLGLSPVGSRINAEGATSSQNSHKDFAQFLTDALRDVNRLQQEAQQASLNLAAGKVQDISEVVIAAEKATIALQLTMQVRNKVVDAYQEVMRMQV
ncbi:flagellar hook-basal body complex subunit FliE [Thermosinus carboxydivorans Nor1]|uniref:Flagellar hook-basal body complex protein FliE n=1 Tax=Thermosinus carboxydivorans Nor1 TaxID=401526 RepID=A1HN43_9FIRM|nr:flagellar hook-basal body complex protein FliE [Thermosinus carboxydivorans]EAX48670.1 flagellar hook-basal body complex subunit FliE [Thermosinus carboxydivorans Nor1]